MEVEKLQEMDKTRDGLCDRLRRDFEPRIVREPDTFIVFGEDFMALIPVPVSLLAPILY